MESFKNTFSARGEINGLTIMKLWLPRVDMAEEGGAVRSIIPPLWELSKPQILQRTDCVSVN